MSCATGWRRLHKLRHTFCSHLAMRGAAPKAIQELAGHESLTTTLRYMHLSPSARDQAIALLNRREFYGNLTATEAEEVCK
jgi:site-specific recombinase XerD